MGDAGILDVETDRASAFNVITVDDMVSDRRIIRKVLGQSPVLCYEEYGSPEELDRDCDLRHVALAVLDVTFAGIRRIYELSTMVRELWPDAVIIVISHDGPPADPEDAPNASECFHKELVRNDPSIIREKIRSLIRSHTAITENVRDQVLKAMAKADLDANLNLIDEDSLTVLFELHGYIERLEPPNDVFVVAREGENGEDRELRLPYHYFEDAELLGRDERFVFRLTRQDGGVLAKIYPVGDDETIELPPEVAATVKRVGQIERILFDESTGGD